MKGHNIHLIYTTIIYPLFLSCKCSSLKTQIVMVVLLEQENHQEWPSHENRQPSRNVTKKLGQRNG